MLATPATVAITTAATTAAVTIASTAITAGIRTAVGSCTQIGTSDRVAWGTIDIEVRDCRS